MTGITVHMKTVIGIECNASFANKALLSNFELTFHISMLKFLQFGKLLDPVSIPFSSDHFMLSRSKRPVSISDDDIYG